MVATPPVTRVSVSRLRVERHRKNRSLRGSRLELRNWRGPGGFAAEPPLTYQPTCKPGSVWPAASHRRRDGHSSGTPVARRIKQPTRTTGPDGPEACAPTSFLFGLAPGGVCRAVFRCRKRGALLPHRFTLTAAKTLRSRGGLFSVALSLRPRPVKGRPRRTLSGTVRPWSPDFPPRPPFGIGAERPSGRLTGIAMGLRGRRVKAARVESVKSAFYASGAGRVSSSARSVSSVEASAMPSTRAGRKWRWKAVTTVARGVVVAAGLLDAVAVAAQRALQPRHQLAAVAGLERGRRRDRAGPGAPNGRCRIRSAGPREISRPDPACAPAPRRNAPRMRSALIGPRRVMIERQSEITAAICRSGKSRIAEFVTRIDDLDADRARIDVGFAGPGRHAGVPGAHAPPARIARCGRPRTPRNAPTPCCPASTAGASAASPVCMPV